MKKFWKNNEKIIKFVLLVFTAWFLVINFLSFLSPFLPIPTRENFVYKEDKEINPSFLWNRASFDGSQYLSISRQGYCVNQQVFFPLYPKLIDTISPCFNGKDLIAGLFISNFSLLLGLFIFYKLILLDYDHQTAKKTLILLLLFPTSFFLGFVYSESLFMLFVISSFYAARKKSWLIAGIFGALAANSRLSGIFIFPALIYEIFESYKKEELGFKIKKMIPVFLVPLGLFFYMRFLHLNFNDSLLFIPKDSSYGADRVAGKIILLHQVFFRYLKMILTTKFDPLYFAVWLEFLSAIGFVFLLAKSFIKKIRESYLIFAVLAFIVPTLVGNFVSLPRYVLSLFPCFILMGTIKNKKIVCLLNYFFGILAVVSVILFFKGYWIA